MTVVFSWCPFCALHYKNQSCSVTFAYVCAFWRGFVNIPSAMTAIVTAKNKQFLLYINAVVVITNCAWFIILAESIQ
jgi:hypothetical protein